MVREFPAFPALRSVLANSALTGGVDTAGNYTCMADEACCTSDGATFCCPKKYELVCGCEGDTCYSCLNDGRYESSTCVSYVRLALDRCLAGMEDVCFSDLGFIIAIIIVVFIILIVATFVGITARLIYIRAKKNKS